MSLDKTSAPLQRSSANSSLRSSLRKELGEFELIQQYFQPLAEKNAEHVDVALGDDCAVLSLAADESLAVSVDTLVEGVHILPETHPRDIATRAIAVSLSDLAAMGARPVGLTIALTLTDNLVENNTLWVEHFASGLAETLEKYQVPLLGGDTTRGEQLCISVQVLGAVPKGQALNRSGARPGDKVYVSGTLGDGAAALAALKSGSENLFFENKFYRPEARIALGQALQSLATAAIDISDGLLADAGHIAKASGVAMTLQLESLPVSTETQQRVGREQALQWACAGGDDYELCFCISPVQEQELETLATCLGLTLTAIGVVEVGEGVSCYDEQGERVDFNKSGYQHFSSDQ